MDGDDISGSAFRRSLLVVRDDEQTTAFYCRVLDLLGGIEVPVLVGGAFAMREYADIVRETKDLDLFCKVSDHPRVLAALKSGGFTVEITDATWLAKAFDGDSYVDVIFGSANGVSSVDDTWFEYAYPATLLDREVRLVSVEDQLWQKAFIGDRFRYDGADVAHIIRASADRIDWHRLLTRMEAHWELLLAHLVQFRYIYPANRNAVPAWLLNELMSRVTSQFEVPVPSEPICRGPLLSKTQYVVDIQEWGYRER
jgi:hypothetical protein